MNEFKNIQIPSVKLEMIKIDFENSKEKYSNLIDAISLALKYKNFNHHIELPDNRIIVGFFEQEIETVIQNDTTNINYIIKPIVDEKNKLVIFKIYPVVESA